MTGNFKDTSLNDIAKLGGMEEVGAGSGQITINRLIDELEKLKNRNP